MLAFDTSVHPDAARVVKAVKDWAYDTARGEQRGLVLYSTGFGAGKTHLARRAAEYVASWQVADDLGVITHKRVTLFNAVEFFGQIKDAYAENKPIGRLFDVWAGAPLVMDDLGKSYTRDGSEGWAQEQLYRVIDRIHTGGYSIFITSNLAPAEMERVVGGAAWSRVMGICGRPGTIIDLSSWPDYRVRGWQPKSR